MSVVTAAFDQFPLKEYTLLIACSGGVDSMVLLHGFLATGLRAKVLHVNYGLRGAESDADEALVRTVCEQANLELEIIRCDSVEWSKPGVNVQATAREIRRKAFAEWIKQSDNHKVLVAHHADDQLETFFLQLFRGSGTFGLGGMHPEREGILRPFLGLTKSDLIVFAQTNAILWREDQSNASSYYLRNLFRNELLPVLKKAVPELEQQVPLLMQLFRERQAELFEQVDPALQQWKENESISCSTWLMWEEDNRIAFVKGIGWPVWTVAQLTKLAKGRRGALMYVKDVCIVKTRCDSVDADDDHLTKDKNDTKFNWEFKSEKIEFLPNAFDKWTIYLDADVIQGELYLKVPEKGDRIRSLGLKGSQLVSDVLKDGGLPIIERKNYPLLVDAGQILWIPGIKLSRDALATEATINKLKVTVIRRSF